MYPNHKNDWDADGRTTLSRYVWDRRDKEVNPVVTLRYLEKHILYFNPVTGICKQCTREKFQIALNPSVASLNLLGDPVADHVA